MPATLLSFALGVFSLQQHAQLPAPTLLAALGGTGVLALASRRLPLLWFGAFCLGYVWAGVRAELRLADALPPAWEGRDLVVVGTVADLPELSANGLRFVLRVEEASGPVPARIILSWRGAAPAAEGEESSRGGRMPVVHAGERWRLQVRLQRPHGTLNFHGFDYEAWLFERNIRATGFVHPAGENFRLAAGPVAIDGAIDRWRERIRDHVLTLFAGKPVGGILAALAIGDQNAIPTELWQLFAATGITHLMSISGLHVTLIGVLIGGLVFQLWRRHPRLPLRLPAQSAGAIATVIGAAAYAALSGFGIPAQRTLLMLTVVVAALLLRRAVAASHVLTLALFVVLLLDPWAVLAAGFWLSFGAVALLFYVASGRRATGHWLVAAARAQWAVTLGLLPALLVLFQQFSLISPFANAVAIPLVSFVVTPLALAGALLRLDLLLMPAAWALEVLLAFLRWSAHLPGAVWQQATPPWWMTALAVAGVLWWLLPRGLPARWLGGVFLLPALTFTPSRPAEGEAWLTVLDVGQGLAVHVQTAHHDLLYDAGPASTAFDAGSRIVAPALIAAGASRLDRLIVSHDDSDHAGGATAVLAALSVGDLLAPGPTARAMPLLPRRCRAGMQWEWDGVRFRILHPTDEEEHYAVSDNAKSCVLQIESRLGSTALLPGDLEGRAEEELRARVGQALRSELLVAAHHGAKKTASAEFLAVVRPSIVVIPVGYRNRYRHPHPATLERYRANAREIWRSDWHGAVKLRLAEKAEVVAYARDDRRRYWHNRPAMTVEDDSR